MQQIKISGQYPDDFQQSYEGDMTEVDLFFEAVYDNQILTVKEMIAKNKMLLSERNERLETPLHIAIRMEKVKLIKFLVESGSDIHTKDLNGNSCYQLIKKSQLFEMQLLFEKYK
jgi:ankyrin repeat protein